MNPDAKNKDVILLQDIRNQILNFMKIDQKLLSEKEMNLLDMHIDAINKQSHIDMRRIGYYTAKHKDELVKDLLVACEATQIKDEFEKFKTTKDEVTRQLCKNLVFDERKFCLLNESLRKKYVYKAGNELFIACQIRSDFNETVSFLKRNKDQKAVIKTVAKEIKNKHYQVIRKFYSFDFYLNGEEIKVTNFNLRSEQFHDRSIMLQQY